MQNFQDTFETCKRSFISAFLICMTVLLDEIYLYLNDEIQIFLRSDTDFSPRKDLSCAN